jgi:dipeptidyl aminopeptidase/acylaminoacyl peptidase
MNYGGSVPEPLLPPDIALQNPTLVGGEPYYVFPKLDQIVVMLDQNGDENYQPMIIPMAGGYPEEAFPGRLTGYRWHLESGDRDHNIAYLAAESREDATVEAIQGRLGDNPELTRMASSPYGNIGGDDHYVSAANKDHTKVALIEGYTAGDHMLYLWESGSEGVELLVGTPLDERSDGEAVPLNDINHCHFTEHDKGLLFQTALFEDTKGLGYLSLSGNNEPVPVEVSGEVHSGRGEFYKLHHLMDDRYLVQYNIDGGSWGYEGIFDEDARKMKLEQAIWGRGELSDGTLQDSSYDINTDSFVLAFSTATTPAQIYSIDRKTPDQIVAHTSERVLGIPQELMSPGEDASYESFDGLRVSARLYLPAEGLGFEGPRPLVYYLHGGPQSQERPDFTWFSMPLIQYLTLHGLAVFVPNVRGSSGYGLSYMKQVDRDWGGQDRLDHVHAMKILKDEPRVDASRTGVVGRSYGGYMTLMLAGRHPDLWSAAVDMFGPYDLITFSERIPPTWKPYFKLAIGDPDDADDRKLLEERSPKTYLDELACPMLVIQGGNDPRVVAQESRDLVADLSAKGKDIDILVFEDEGHDVLKYDNRVRCYNAITEFFQQKLMDGSS